MIGKIRIEQPLAEYALAKGDAFELRELMDAFSDAGVIPVSLVRWELTGDESAVRQMLSGGANR